MSANIESDLVDLDTLLGSATPKYDPYEMNEIMRDFKWTLDLKYWQSGEWQVIQERLDDLAKAGRIICPRREDLFKALDLCPFEKTKVVILGQDPYPEPMYATGVAFSVPGSIRSKDFPVTLKNIFKEYCTDLKYPDPSSGDLTKWAEQGVLLWNALPSCSAHTSLSHNWEEWDYLTKEIIQCLNDRGIVFVALGGFAREYVKFMDAEKNEILEFSHPSPRGNINSKNPFLGSRIFTTINDKLRKLGETTIDWKL